MVYLDWAAAAPCDNSILTEAADRACSAYGNPSASHPEGRAARTLLEEARARAAAALRVLPKHIVFTSGASEANNIVCTSLMLRETRGSVVVPAFEHASVYEPCRLLRRLGFEVRFVTTDRTGMVDPERVARAVDENTVLLCLMHVNNATGAVQPLPETVTAVRKAARSGRRIHIHTDLTQSIGRLPPILPEVDVDSASMSGHKLGAPRGAGVLVLRKTLEPLYRGGGQENGMRPGTENLLSIWGTMRALERHAVPTPETLSRAHALASLLTREVSAAGTRAVHGEDPSTTDRFSPFIRAFSFPPVPAEVLVRTLADRGYIVSTGAACSSQRDGDARVFEATGYTREEAASALRVSWGPDTTEEQLSGFVDALGDTVATLRKSLTR